MTDVDPASAVNRVIEFLERCGETDIQEGVGLIFGLGSDAKQKAFKDGLARAILGEIVFEYSDDLSLFGKDGWNYTQEGPDGWKIVRIKPSPAP